MDYIAVIHKDEGSDVGVSFPDLPGCVTAGATLEEARVFAAEALALHLEAMAEAGMEIACSRSFGCPLAAYFHTLHWGG